LAVSMFVGRFSKIPARFSLPTISQKKWVSYLYRTATTTYPCFRQDLGDSAGADRIRLTRHKSI